MLYTARLATTDASVEKAPFNLEQALIDACLTVPKNLQDVADNLLDPLGLNIGTVDDVAAAASEQEVNAGTFAAMQQSFDGKAGAFRLFVIYFAVCALRRGNRRNLPGNQLELDFVCGVLDDRHCLHDRNYFLSIDDLQPAS